MKKLLVLILVVLMTAGMASASDVRVNTMGGANIKDISGMATYPQVILGYPNLMYTTINGGAMWGVGGTYALPVGVLGLAFNQGVATNTYFPPVPVNGGAPTTVADQKLGLTYGYDLGDIQLGLGLTLGGNSYVKNYVKNTPNDKTETSISNFGLNVGATLIKNLDLGINFAMESFTNNDFDGKVITEGSGNTTFGIDARYWMEMSPKYVMIPYVGFAMAGEGRTGGPGVPAVMPDGDKIEDAGTAFTVGIGNNMHFSDAVMAVADLGIEYNKVKTTYTPKTGTAVETSVTNMSLPYFRIGLEGKVTNWMDLRMGATKVWASKTEENRDADTEDWGFVRNNFVLGAGFHFNALDIDAELDPGFLTRGIYFVSGSGGNIATKVALTYTFDKK